MKIIYGLTAAAGFNAAFGSIFSQNHYSSKSKSSTGILQLPASIGLFQKVFLSLNLGKTVTYSLLGARPGLGVLFGLPKPYILN